MQSMPAGLWGPVLVALPTPMTEAGEIDHGAVVRHVRWLAQSGADGLVVGGVAGERDTLSVEERVGLWETALAATEGAVSVWADVSAADARIAAQLAAGADAAGCHGVLLAVPAGPGGRLFAHRTVGQTRTAVLLADDERGGPGGAQRTAALLELARTLDQPAGILTGGGPRSAAGVLCGAQHEIRVLAQEDAASPVVAAMGGAGGVSAVANLAPAAVRALWLAAARGDASAALAAYRRLWPTVNALGAGEPVALLKGALARRHVGTATVRPPLLAATAAACRALAEAAPSAVEALQPERAAARSA